MRVLDKPIRRQITAQPPDFCAGCGRNGDGTGRQEWNATFTPAGIYVQMPRSRKGKRLFFTPWQTIVDAAIRRGLVIDRELLEAARARAKA